jgi:hypothetical protein
MKRKLTIKLLIAAIFCIGALDVNAQAYQEGTSIASVGYGVGFSWKAWWDVYDSESTFESSNFGPVVLRYEYGINDKFSMGLYFAHQKSTGKWTDTYTDPFTLEPYTFKYEVSIGNTALLGRGSYHIKTKNNKLDPYAGLAMGFRNYSYDVTSNDPDFNYNFSFGGAFGFGMHAGVRYEFTPLLGAYAEFGVGQVAAIQAGVAAKF